VDDHADEVDADRVVLVESLGDRELRADAVGAAGQERLAVLAEVELEQAGKPAEPPDHLGPTGPRDLRLHEPDGPGARLDVHAGCGVRRLRQPGLVVRQRGASRDRFGHGLLSAPSAPWLPSIASTGWWSAGSSVTVRVRPSSTCLPMRSCSGSGIG